MHPLTLTSGCFTVQFIAVVDLRAFNVSTVFFHAPTFAFEALLGFEAVVILTFGDVNVFLSKIHHASYGFTPFTIILGI